MIHARRIFSVRLRCAIGLIALSLYSPIRALAAPIPIRFVDATKDVNLPLMNSARLCLVDLNTDGRADVVAKVQTKDGQFFRVFLNHADASAKYGFRFDEISANTLPSPSNGDLIAFADLDNDGIQDAIFTRYLDLQNPKFVDPSTRPKTQPTTQPTTQPDRHPRGTCWLRGNGDGTFGEPQPIASATRGTTACLAVGDADGDGLPDILLGNWYDRYGDALTAYPSDLLLQRRDANGAIHFERSPLPTDGVPFDEERDAGARPTYGVMFVRLDESASLPSLLMLSYGRRANRLLVPVSTNPLRYEDRAVAMHLDGDDIRHGRYPDWLKELAKTDKRFSQEDEKPFRSHGNNFDAALGDINNDGKFDLFFADITHAWAGESADRSRLLFQKTGANDAIDFAYDPSWSVDRVGTHDVPPATTESTTRPTHPSWNQGDLFSTFADLDQDGRLDLILCSSDYPDPPPHENRLRIFQNAGDHFVDMTGESGIDQIGAQQPTLADLDGDGDLDLLVGQSFNRFTNEMIDARTPPGPVARIFLNQTSELRRAANRIPNGLTIHLLGDPSRHVTRQALNAIISCSTHTADRGSIVQKREFIGPGGHNGKEGDLLVHFGLGESSEADEIRVDWNAAPSIAPTVVHHVRPGDIRIVCGE